MRVAVIGLGRFGYRLACELFDRKIDVIAVDLDPRRVEDFEEYGGHALALDATSEIELRRAELHRLDLAVVCIGEEVEQSQLVTHLLKNQLEMERVISRAHTDARDTILRAIGSDEVLRPESDSAVRLAQRLAFRGCEEFLELAPGVAMVRLRAPKHFVEKTILQLEVRPRFRVNIIGIRSSPGDGESPTKEATLELVPEPGYTFQEGDELLVVGREEDIRRMMTG
ncbi:MAG: TrkA family potassium uptake protein [Planctomycetota bacterium]